MQESSWRPLGMPLPAASATKHSMRDDRRCEDFTLGDLSRRNANTLGSYCLYVRNVHLNCMKIAAQCPIVFRNFACGALDKLSTFSPKFRFSLLTMTVSAAYATAILYIFCIQIRNTNLHPNCGHFASQRPTPQIAENIADISCSGQAGLVKFENGTMQN